ncbi:hypothetical protein EHS13_02535 [Paenibacillus psychroresistens]|uniref:Uncharacterized protein n=1 Tax=Paenibacillus psychroresistens TaxID=1778678 RepID=A0A6B8RCD3_9BACL|nr:hypothetical protein [Paenibacillus psychroresistens]QGQ93860.1 hypothetical protein EHS13_02535 [Paenibacillus psychroresistens]
MRKFFDNYDLILKFEGYKDIHMNLELKSFWFEGNDLLYRISELIDPPSQWDRYLIRSNIGNLMYDSFEKTILGKGVYTDGSEIENRVKLYYDGDVRLSVNKAEMVIGPFFRQMI